MALFEIKNLSFAYTDAKYRALDNIDLEIESGSFNVVTGESGSGKTTLLRHLKPQIAPFGLREGGVFFDGQDINSAPADSIGYVMQNPQNQVISQKVYENLAFGLENTGMPGDRIFSRLAEVSNYFNITKLFRQSMDKLSGGQQQIVNLAAVCALNPKALVLDEPFGFLDPKASYELLNLLIKLNNNFGVTVIISAHNCGEFFHLCDNIIIMDNGRIKERLRPKEYAREGQSLQGGQSYDEVLPCAASLFKGLKTLSALPLTVSGAKIKLLSLLKEGKLKIKNNTKTDEKQDRKNALKKSGTAVKLSGVFYKYSKDTPFVLDNVSLQIKSGKVLCIAGGNGSGKTTLLNVIGGGLKSTDGKIELLKKDIAAYKKGSLYEGTVSALPQNVQLLFTKNTVMQELEDMTDDKEKIGKIVALCELEDMLLQNPFDLSGGRQQIAAFAMVLLCESKILLLDEPTRGTDAKIKKQIGNIIKALCSQNITVIMATHDLDFAASYADECCMLFDGRISEPKIAEEFFSENILYTTQSSILARALNLKCASFEKLSEALEINE